MATVCMSGMSGTYGIQLAMERHTEFDLLDRYINENMEIRYIVLMRVASRGEDSGQEQGKAARETPQRRGANAATWPKKAPMKMKSLSVDVQLSCFHPRSAR